METIMKKALGDAMDDPEKALERYCWRKPSLHNDGSARWQLPALPAYIGKAEKHGNRKKRYRHHNPWPYPINLLETLYWFWAGIEWHKKRTDFGTRR